MKLQSIFMLVLAVALVFALIGSIVGEFRTYYQTDEEVSTSWENKYNYAFNTNPQTGESVNESFFSLQSELEKLKVSEGWEKILNGLMVFGKGILIAIAAVLMSPLYAGSILYSIAQDLNVPDVVINTLLPIAMVMIFGAVIFMIVRFTHRSGGQV